MGFFDWFRRRPRPTPDGAPTPAAPARDTTKQVRARFGAQAVARFRAFHPGLATESLALAGTAPFEWVEGTLHEGPIVTTVRMVWTGAEVVELNGVDGLRVLLPQGRAAGLDFDALVTKAAELVHLRIHRSREAVAALCDPAGGWAAPADAALLERFEPPRTDAAGMTFFAEASPRPFITFGNNRSDIVRVTVDRETLAVTAEVIGQGVQHQSPFDANGRPPPGIMMPGRALVADDGAVVTAAVPASRTAEAARWREQALGEHASVASFSRAVLELMAAGAPLALIERLHEAALDEIRHTRQCLERARQLDGRDVTLGPVPALAPRPGTRADIARRTLDEAARPETFAARELAARAAATDDAELRALLTAQAADEARHARLAWDIVAWCGDTGAA